MADLKINDIVKKTKEQIFNDYIPKKEIGGRILDDFIKRYVKGKGFAIDDNKKDGFGIISNCMALSTLIELYDFETDKIKIYYPVFSELINLILDSICQNNQFIFDAAPYLYNNAEQNIYIDSYIETISKVIITFIDLRDIIIECIEISPGLAKKSEINFLINYNGKQVSEPKDILVIIERIVLKCISILNKAALKNSKPFDFTIDNKIIKRDDVDSKVEYRGWTFQCPKENENHDSYETSLYFTYHATNAYLSFYNSFRYLVDNDNKIKGNPKELFENEPYELLKYEMDLDFYTSNEDILIDYRNRCISSGRYLEKTFIDNGVDITFDFIGKNLKKISYDEVVKYQSSNSVIDIVFTAAILINAALDEDYEFLKLQNVFYDKLQFMLTNVKKVYSSLRKIRKEDLINTYCLEFNEKTPNEYDLLMQKFRQNCRGIKTYDLIALLGNTYNVIFDFLIKYPDKEMVTYLEMVMENRNDTEWTWNKESFSINNNLYYLLFIEYFYVYYDIYERPLSEKGKKYNLIAEKANEKYIKLEINVKDKDRKIKELEKKLFEKKSDLDKEVEMIAKKIFDDNIEVSIRKYLEDMITDNIEMSKEINMKKGPSFKYSDVCKKHHKGHLARQISFSSHIQGIVDSYKIADRNDINALDEDIHKKILDKYQDYEKQMSE